MVSEQLWFVYLIFIIVKFLDNDDALDIVSFGFGLETLLGCFNYD